MNIGAGLSFFAWAVLGILSDSREGELSPARWTVGGLNLFVGALFLIREPIHENAPVSDLVKALGSFLICGITFRLAQPLWTWPVLSHILIATGASVAILAFAFLGRSFAIFPAKRAIKIGGPYRLIRHPAYFGELLMVVACVAAVPSITSFGLLAGALFLTIVRIRVEERFLHRTDDLYREYRSRVKYRLLPGIW